MGLSMNGPKMPIDGTPTRAQLVLLQFHVTCSRYTLESPTNSGLSG